MSPTSQAPVYITKSISPIHANVHRRNLRLWFVIPSSALNSVGSAALNIRLRLAGRQPQGHSAASLTRFVSSYKFVLLKLESLSTMRNSSSFSIKRLK